MLACRSTVLTITSLLLQSLHPVQLSLIFKVRLAVLCSIRRGMPFKTRLAHCIVSELWCCARLLARRSARSMGMQYASWLFLRVIASNWPGDLSPFFCISAVVSEFCFLKIIGSCVDIDLKSSSLLLMHSSRDEARILSKLLKHESSST